LAQLKLTLGPIQYLVMVEPKTKMQKKSTEAFGKPFFDVEMNQICGGIRIFFLHAIQVGNQMKCNCKPVHIFFHQ